MKNKLLLIAGLLLLILLLAFFALAGGRFLSLSAFWKPEHSQWALLWGLRIPRVLAAFLVGGILASGGLIFQSIFKNDLASPFTLGIASGASCGALLGITLKLLFPGATALFAFAGAFVSVLLVLAVAARVPHGSVSTILLAGIAVNFFFGAVILFLQYLSPAGDLALSLRWMMGGIDVYGTKDLVILLPFYAGIGILTFLFARHLDILRLGEELALGKGVPVRKTRTWLFIWTSLFIAGAVSLAGPIGFVGIIIPHLAKLFFPWGHRRLFLLCLAGGGIFLAFTDTLARTLFYPAELPVGVLTAAVGVPFFLFKLIKR
ncbi:MAG TPA: iron ABC transporter permease [Candidatus Mcinerneyibacteriales bacterium]|nr:iron ABC transporter permease [Candidatus Mcinerneyibacteriales bacterium]